MYSTQTLITLTPDQLGELLRSVVRSELDSYVPPLPEGSNLPELLTRKQTADALQISLGTLHSWAKDTEDRAAILVPVKVNTKIRYHRSEVMAILKKARRYEAKSKG